MAFKERASQEFTRRNGRELYLYPEEDPEQTLGSIFFSDNGHEVKLDLIQVPTQYKGQKFGVRLLHELGRRIRSAYGHMPFFGGVIHAKSMEHFFQSGHFRKAAEKGSTIIDDPRELEQIPIAQLLIEGGLTVDRIVIESGISVEDFDSRKPEIEEDPIDFFHTRIEGEI